MHQAGVPLTHQVLAGWQKRTAVNRAVDLNTADNKLHVDEDGSWRPVTDRTAYNKLRLCCQDASIIDGDDVMAAITVRRLDESVVQRLKARAEINGRSLEGEVRQILGAAVDNDMDVRKRVFRARIEQLQKEITLKGPHTPSEVLIREDRDRNHGR